VSAGQLALEHRAKGGAAADVRPADGKVRCAAPNDAHMHTHATRCGLSRLSLSLSTQHEILPLDATLVDVYAGAHAVVFLVGALCAPRVV
jgi:hypothetical protein